jgi:limonene-1,2-epoxide hydrolase
MTTPAPERLVLDFCAAWARRDIDELLGYFTDDAVYHNVPIDPVVGRDAIRSVFELFVTPAEAITFEVRNVANRGDVVFTERVDRFRMGGKDIELPVAGVFEVRDGRIAAWRDYFDMATWTRQAGG